MVGTAGVVLLAVLTACSGQATFQVYPSQSGSCTPTGPTRRYVSSSISIPVSEGDFAVDFNGDGKKENGLYNLGNAYMLVADLGGGNMTDLINRNGIGRGQGLVLFEVQANETEPGCASVSLAVGASAEGTMPRFDGTDQLKIALGHRFTTLPASGTQSAVASTDYSKLTERDLRTIDLLFPVRNNVLHLRLHAAHVELSSVSENEIQGQIHGVIYKEEMDRTFSPFLTAEASALLNQNPDSAVFKQRLRFIEDNGGAVSAKKCEIAERCCRTNPTTCKFLPAEARSILDILRLGKPDVQVLGRDAFSIGIGFRAVTAEFTPSCAQGRFCPEPQLVNTFGYAGWASRLSDAWMVLEDGRFMHFDGLNWRKEYQDPNMADRWAMGGRSYDDMWTVSSEGLLHWDGAFFTVSPAPTAALFRAFVPDGEKGFLAAAANEKAAPLGGLFAFDGTSWSPIPGYDQEYTSVFTFPSGEAWAVGPEDRFAYRGPGGWGTPPSTLKVDGFGARALYGFAPDDLWVFGVQNVLSGGCHHFDGKQWSPDNACKDMDNPIDSAWASGPEDIWGGGEGTHVVIY